MTNRFGADWKHEAEQINVHEAGDSFAALLGKLTPDVFPVATKYDGAAMTSLLECALTNYLGY